MNKPISPATRAWDATLADGLDLDDAEYEDPDEPAPDLDYLLAVVLNAYRALGTAMETTYATLPGGDARKQLYALYQRGHSLGHSLTSLDADVRDWLRTKGTEQ